jgi:enterochelin esterase family protein
MRTDYRAGMTPDKTLVTGSSFGGLCAMYTGFRHSDVIGLVLSNSGSFQHLQGSDGTDVAEWTEGGWLIRDIGAAARKPLEIYLDAGRFERDLRDSNRHMRDVLAARGYKVTYAEFSGGHDYWIWRGTIADGMIALLRKR